MVYIVKGFKKVNVIEYRQNTFKSFSLQLQLQKMVLLSTIFSITILIF